MSNYRVEWQDPHMKQMGWNNINMDYKTYLTLWGARRRVFKSIRKAKRDSKLRIVNLNTRFFTPPDVIAVYSVKFNQ